MIADTSQIHGFSAAQGRHADDLGAVAADLRAATVTSDAFGSVGMDFLAALNRALLDEARQAARLAERLDAAGSNTATAADAYTSAEDAARQSLSALRA